MISQGVFNKKQFNVEVYPLRLKLIDSRDDSEFTIRLSKKVPEMQFVQANNLIVATNIGQTRVCNVNCYMGVGDMENRELNVSA